MGNQREGSRIAPEVCTLGQQKKLFPPSLETMRQGRGRYCCKDRHTILGRLVPKGLERRNRKHKIQGDTLGDTALGGVTQWNSALGIQDMGWGLEGETHCYLHTGMINHTHPYDLLGINIAHHVTGGVFVGKELSFAEANSCSTNF